MSDNGSGGGGKGRNRIGGLTGGKGSVWEGGIRSPLVIRGPKIPANSWCHERVVGYDFFPTYCEWAGIEKSKLPSGIEGGSITGLLDDGLGTVVRPRKEMVFHFPHYQSGDGPHSALLLGDLKLMKFYETGRLALFDLTADISEKNDLASRMPKKVKELDAVLVKYLSDIDAQMAVPNSNYDPTNQQPSQQKNRRGDRKSNQSNRNGKRQKSNRDNGQ
jgi:arylsulfatase A-like enzyme